MNKQEFLEKLRKGLSGLPQDGIEERLTFYSEIIEDRIEEGFSEEEAVRAAGPIDEIVEQAVAETPLVKIAKERKKAGKGWGKAEIIFLAAGFPIWLPLGIAVFAIYFSIWAVIFSLWAVFGSFVISFVCAIPGCVLLASVANVTSGFAMLALGMVCAGLSVFTFYGCMALTKGMLSVTNKIIIGIKNFFIRREEA